MLKTKMIHAAVNPTVYDMLTALAKKEDCSVSSLVRKGIMLIIMPGGRKR